jgi:hypothetical protein
MLSILRPFLLFSALYLSVEALPKITRTGRFLFDPSGNRFYIKGVAYQPPGVVIQSADNPFGTPSTFTDPLADTAGCQRDLPFLQQLGVNTIRSYAVNSSLNHDGCMNLFSQNNIYVILDLELPLNGSINPLAPAWSTNLLDEYITTMEVFSKYDNVLAFNVGNEVVQSSTTGIAPFIKSAARDVKAYLASTGSSTLVGYGSIDMASDVKLALANFLSCDPTGKNDGSTAIDLFGLNNYEWCGDSTFENSYAGVTSAFADYNVVAYFAEFGCITKPPRLWTETEALFGSQMTPVWSGGLAFSYFPSVSNDGQFGLVNISGSTVTTGSDFDTLKTEYAKISFINTPTQAAAPAAAYPSCAAPTSDFVAANALPATPNGNACNCVESALSCQFTPATTNTSAIIGTLTDQACQFLGQASLNCNDISSNGTTGVFGVMAQCDPSVKLSYVMSLYYESQNRNAMACSFAGNGTVNAAATASASAVASSCIANPSSVFTPSAVSTPSQVTQPPSTGTGASSGGNGSGSKSGAETHAVFGVGTMLVISLVSAAWTFA